ncbi:MAG: transposase [Treponema sp.]|jgi:hypothetical protein|nr:transposase [Treponema sp.]
MGNHIHFLIKPGKDANLSEIMQWIKCNFAKAWNKAHGRKGHVWGERFYSRIIGGIDDFLRTREYITENPVKAGACGAGSGMDVWKSVPPATSTIRLGRRAYSRRRHMSDVSATCPVRCLTP